MVSPKLAVITVTIAQYIPRGMPQSTGQRATRQAFR